MSRIYFHTQSEDDAEVRGSERAHMAITCSNVFDAMFGLNNYDFPVDWIKPLLPNDCFFKHDRDNKSFCSSLKSWLHYDSEAHLLLDGESLTGFELVLNTALSIGNDPLKLMARLHGQCEIHCFVEGHNRGWLADIIQEGLGLGLYRENEGWSDVIELLRDRNNAPVVCSYSVCDSFPSTSLLPDDYPLNGIDNEALWAVCLNCIREDGDSKLELKPDDWQTFRFSHKKSAFDILKASKT